MKFAAQLVTYSCAHVQRELLTERLACSAGPELISISDSRKAGSDYEEDVGCRWVGQYSGHSYRGIFAHFHRVGSDGGGGCGSYMKKKMPSTTENFRHRDRPHKFAIVTMEVEKGGTEWNGRIGGRERGD